MRKETGGGTPGKPEMHWKFNPALKARLKDRSDGSGGGSSAALTTTGCSLSQPRTAI
jgi:hypothetical protein